MTDPAPPRAPHPSGHDLRTRLDRLERFGPRNACFWRDGVRWRRRTYAELHGRVHGCAARLAAAGAGEGTPILIQGPAGPDWVEALLATFLLGAVAVPLDEASPESFRAEVSRRSGVKVSVAPHGLPAPPGCTAVRMGAWGTAPAPAAAPWDPERTAELVFTSGTTGEPKGVILTHGNLAADFGPIERAFLKREHLLRPLGEIRFLSTLPLSHMFGQLMNVFLPLFMGLTVAFVPARPRDVMEAARRLRAWGLFTVPRLLDLLGAEARLLLREAGKLESFQRRQERFAAWPFYLQILCFGSLRRMLGWRFRLFVSGGAPLPEAVQGFWERAGFLVIQGYGLTETAPIVSISNPFERRSGSVGKPLGIQELKLGPGGEVMVRGPNVTSGYLGESGAAKDEWFHTGDIGEIDEKGRLKIRGRVKDVIVTAEGENVYPPDVESALAQSPGVREACVLGLPGSGGERVHAVLLLDAGADAEEAVRRANATLQARQRIKDFTVWTEGDLPRTATGKIRKGILRDRLLSSRDTASAGDGEARGGGGVRRLVARVARIDPARIEPSARLVEDLGFASLDLVELSVAFEEEYGLALPEESLASARVSDLERAATESYSGAVYAPVVQAREDRQESTALGESQAAEGSSSLPSEPAPGGAQEPFPPTVRTQSARQAGGPSPAESQGRRGSLRMPRWARRAPMRWIRRGMEELLFRPFVLCFTRPEMQGLEHLEQAQLPILLVGNHRSYFDTGLLKTVLPRRLRGRFVAAMTTRYHRVHFGEIPGGFFRRLKEWIQVRLVEFFFNTWPLPETAGFRSSLSYAGELADAGWSLLIFPEGRHVPEGRMEKFRGGIGIFARELRMPVVPFYIEGTGRVLPDGRYWPHFGKTRLVIGHPLQVDPEADPAETTRRLEEAVRALWTDGQARP